MQSMTEKYNFARRVRDLLLWEGLAAQGDAAQLYLGFGKTGLTLEQAESLEDQIDNECEIPLGTEPTITAKGYEIATNIKNQYFPNNKI